MIHRNSLHNIKIMTLALAATLLGAMSAMARGYRLAEIDNVHLADSTRFTSNPDRILSPAAQQQLDMLAGEIRRATSAEVSIVAVREVDGDPTQFATQLFERWKPGKADRDNGLLLLLALDQGEVVLRPGYGLEGVLPDAICGRILNRAISRHFSKRDIDGGMIEVMSSVKGILEDPDNAAEIWSDQPNDRREPISTGLLIETWLKLAGIASAGLLLWYLLIMARTRHSERYERYQKLRSMWLPTLVITIMGLGIPAYVLLILWLTMHRTRRRHHKCTNCGHEMRRLDEVTDNNYLTPAQDTEERIKSVDYDVWLCDNCGETDILPFVNPTTSYVVCPLCGSRAASLRNKRILVHPTSRSAGQGVMDYYCENCHNHHQKKFTIPKTDESLPLIIGGIGGALGGRGGGGGFGGGSWGGGMTGGGGATGHF